MSAKLKLFINICKIYLNLHSYISAYNKYTVSELYIKTNHLFEYGV